MRSKLNSLLEKKNPVILKSKADFNAWWKDAEYNLNVIGFDDVLGKIIDKQARRDKRPLRLVENHTVATYLNKTVRLPEYTSGTYDAEEMLVDIFEIVGYVKTYSECAKMEWEVNIDLNRSKAETKADWNIKELTWRVSGYKIDQAKILNNMARNISKNHLTNSCYKILLKC